MLTAGVGRAAVITGGREAAGGGGGAAAAGGGAGASSQALAPALPELCDAEGALKPGRGADGKLGLGALAPAPAPSLAPGAFLNASISTFPTGV